MKLRLLFFLLLFAANSYAQNTWQIMFAPVFSNRVDDLFMASPDTGYAVSGDGQIVKTVNGGSNWSLLTLNSSVYCRSVEFVNPQIGFVGGFRTNLQIGSNILRKTSDGGQTWTDLTNLLHPVAQQGICGLAAADANTIYGCGNWYEDSAYIVKTTDQGATWSFIDMSMYATSLIDLYFISPDTGFATGKGPMPLETAVILYTTDGGQTWTYKFQNTYFSEFCWKIFPLTDQIIFASVEEWQNTGVSPQILKSIDGGMNWTVYQVQQASYNIEGIGFIDSLHGWTGGDWNFSFETVDGGQTWAQVPICPIMNRVFRINDSILFASGSEIWRYAPLGTGIRPTQQTPIRYVSLNCNPNPVSDVLTIDLKLEKSTQAHLSLLDEQGRQIRLIDNTVKPNGTYQYKLETAQLPAGIYYVVIKTHEDKASAKIVVTH